MPESPPVVSFGEFVIVEGRSGVVVPTQPPEAERLAVWFGETEDDNPVVCLVLPERIYRWDGRQGPTYYH